MNKKLWLAGGLLASVYVPYYFISGADSPPGPVVHPDQAIITPEPAAQRPDPPLSGAPGPRTPVRSIRPSDGTTTTERQPSQQPAALPAPVTGSTNPPASVQLWQTPASDATVDIDGVPGVQLQVDPEHLRKMRLGQTLVLEIPGSSTVIETELTDTYNDPGGVQVWQGHINGEVDEAAVIVSRGKTHTHMIIASEHGNYSVVINNQSGESTFIDEGYIQNRQAPIDDAVYVDPPDSIPLPSIQ